MVDAIAIRRSSSLGIVPAGDDARISAAAHIARERIADDHRLVLVKRLDGRKNLVKKFFSGLLRTQLLGEEHAVHQRTEAGEAQFFCLRGDRSVGNDILAHLAAQRLDNMIAVIAADDGIAKAQLIGVVEARYRCPPLQRTLQSGPRAPAAL